MKDTSQKVMKYMNDKFDSLSSEERIEMATSMFDFAREIVLSSIKQERPEASDADIKLELFLRFYGEDFTDPVQREKILQGLGFKFE